MHGSFRRLLAALAAAALLFTGCSEPGDNGETAALSDDARQETVDNAAQLAAASGDYAYADEDLDSGWDLASATAITLNGSSIDVDGSGAGVDGSTVTITTAGTYVLSGQLDDGQVIVAATKDDLVRLVLNGVTIHNSTSAPVWSQKAAKTVVILAEGSVNTLTDEADYHFDDGGDEPNAVLFAKDDLTINGSGSLKVTGSYNNGIGTKDVLVITGGDIEVTAAHDGMRGRDGVAILTGSITVDAANDGIKSNNSGDGKGFIVIDGGQFTVSADHDAIQAESTLTVNDGSFDIITGGGAANAPERTVSRGFGGGMGGRGDGGGPGMQQGEAPQAPDTASASADTQAGLRQLLADSSGDPQAEEESAESESTSRKGFKAGTNITINGGSFAMDCEDDAFHSNGDMLITGGSFTISTGDDGMHADNALVIEGGDIDILTCYEGLEGATVEISDGVIRIKASDDGINAAGGNDSNGGGPGGRDNFASRSSYYLHITGGYIGIEAENGDGIDSNGTLTIDGGEIYVQGPAGGVDSALDSDGNITINGGLVVGTGAAAMLDMPGADSAQATLAVVYTETQEAGVELRLDDTDGNTIVQFTPQKRYPSVLISAPRLQIGETYTLYADGAELGRIELTGISTTTDETGAAVTVRGFGGGGMGGGPGGGGGTPPGGTMPDMDEGGGPGGGVPPDGMQPPS